MMDGLPESLIESAREITEAASKEQKAVQQAMRKELDKLGVNSPADLDKEARKKLFNKIDKMFKSDAEVSGKDVEPEDIKATKESCDTKKKSSVNEAKGKHYYTIGGDRWDGGVVVKVYVNGKEVASDIGDGDHPLQYKKKKYNHINKFLDAVAKDHKEVKSGKDFKRIEQESKKMDEAVVSEPEEQYYRVEVVNGVTGKMADFVVAALTKKHAEEDVLCAAHNEEDLTSPDGIGGRPALVVNSVEEISYEEFEAESEDDYE